MKGLDLSSKKILPKCKNGNTSYFSSEGRWLPCCSFPHFGKLLEESIFSRDEYLIKNNNEFDKFHEKDSFKLWTHHTEENYEKAYNICKRRCSERSHTINKKNKDVNWVMDEVKYIRNKKELYDYCEKNNINFDFEKIIDEI